MKIIGNQPNHHVDNTKRAKAKRAEKAEGFENTLQSKKPAADSVKLNTPSPVSPSYSPPQYRRADTSSKPQVEPIVNEVLQSPEEVNSRVDEIKKLIDEGGVEAYFKTVDSEKVAERLLNSGNFDDFI